MTAQTFADCETAIRDRDAEPATAHSYHTQAHVDRRLCLAEIDRLRAMLGRDDGKQLVIERLERERDDLAAENARLNMEMVAYREKLTPADAQAMRAVMDALDLHKRCAASAKEA